jgi:hypothetical protein
MLAGGKALWRFPLHDRPPEAASFWLFFPVYFILCFFTLHHLGVPSKTIDTHLRKKFRRNRTSRGQSTSPCFSSQVVLLYTRAISSEHKTVSAWRGYRIKGVHNWIAKSLVFLHRSFSFNVDLSLLSSHPRKCISVYEL